MIDKIDRLIIDLLKQNSKLPLKDIGELICYIKNNPLILEAHKISGQGCYLLKVTCSSIAEVNAILDDLNNFGTYLLNLSTSTIK